MHKVQSAGPTNNFLSNRLQLLVLYHRTRIGLYHLCTTLTRSKSHALRGKDGTAINDEFPHLVVIL